jgi:multiple sugar transport system substrate-binding protein
MPTVPPGESALPAGGVPATTIVSGQNLVVASYSQQQDLALQYVELVTSEAEQKHFSEVFGVLPANAAAADAVASGKAQYAPVLEAGKQSKPTPFTGAWSEIQLGLTNITVQSLAGLSAGSVPPDQVQRQLTDLQKTAQAAVDKAAAAR